MAAGLAIGAVAVVVGLLAASHSIANILTRYNPARALQFQAAHPVALAAESRRQFGLGNTANAKTLAEKSIQNSAIPSEAVQVLGVAYLTEDENHASQLFKYASRLTKRELAAQTFLFQRALLSSDMKQALHHMDVALRVSEKGDTIFFPVLAAAMADDKIAPEITEMFLAEPPWLPKFVIFTIRNSTSLNGLIRAVSNLSPASPARTLEIQAMLLKRLAELGQYEAAERFLGTVQGGGPDSLVRDGRFAREDRYPPFDWVYVDEPGKWARRLRGEGGLEYFAGTGLGGRVVAQLVTLSPGKYEFLSAARKETSDADGSATWTVTCVDAPDELARIALPGAPTESLKEVSGTFEVPADGCPAQWLELVVGATFAPSGTGGSVGSVDIRPVA